MSKEGAALLELPRQGAVLVGDAIAQLGFSFSRKPEDLTAEHRTDPVTLLTMPLSVVIFGATGDLARKKLFPALYQLCVLGLLPRDVNIVAWSRKPLDRATFLTRQCVNVREDLRMLKEDFTDRIALHCGGYDAPDAYAEAARQLASYENGEPGNRLFYCAVPLVAFSPIAELVSAYMRAEGGGFTRLLVEKSFGRDTASFEALHAVTSRLFAEAELFRIDHYNAKEVVLNIPSLRWANQLFEPTWSREHIESVQLTFKEDLGMGGRGGFFEREGIIRDVIRSHLMQAFLWLAMEPPLTMGTADIVRAKMELLRCIQPPSADPSEAFLAQFAECGGEPGYLDDPSVPRGSRCPTFASLVLRVNNDRWRGVPFLFTAGKGLDERVCELRVRYRPHALSDLLGSSEHRNELVMRVQPDEALYMLTVAKEPGVTTEQVRKQVCMDMRYDAQFADSYVGDAYERVLLSAARGEHALFVSAAELAHLWRIFTPLLKAIEEAQPQPVAHPFGLLPAGYVSWAAERGVTIHPTWKEFVAMHAELVDDLVRVFAELDVDNSGGLDAGEVSKLARRFFDGREPTPARVQAVFRGFDLNDDGKITLDELIAGSQKLHRAFSRDCNRGPSMDDASEHVHI